MGGGRVASFPPVVIVGLCYPSIPQAPTVTSATLPQMYYKATRSEGRKIDIKREIERSLITWIYWCICWFISWNFHTDMDFKQYKVMHGYEMVRTVCSNGPLVFIRGSSTKCLPILFQYHPNTISKPSKQYLNTTSILTAFNPTADPIYDLTEDHTFIKCLRHLLNISSSSWCSGLLCMCYCM